MSASKRSGTPITQKAESSLSSDKSAISKEANLPPLSYCARFLHGSPDSRDVDCVYLIDPRMPFPSHLQLLEFCRSDTEDRNVVQLAQENIDHPNWFVKTSFRGPPDEVNNALLATHRVDPTGVVYEFPISEKCTRSVLLRYAIASKAIIVKMRRIEACRKECITALASWSFSQYMAVVHSNCSPNFVHLNQDAAKYVTFHMAQSYALSLGLETYTKRELVAFFPDLEPIIYFQGEGEATVSQQSVSMMNALELKWYAQTTRIIVSQLNRAHHLQSFFLDTKGHSKFALNYLEVDCGGSVIEMQSERLCALGCPIPLLLPPLAVESSKPSSSTFGTTLRYPPTWSDTVFTVSNASAGENSTNETWILFGLVQDHPMVFYDVLPSGNPSSISLPSNQKKSKAKTKTSTSKNGSIADESVSQIANSILSQLTSHTPIVNLHDLYLSICVSEGKLVRSIARSRLTLRTVDLNADFIAATSTNCALWAQQKNALF
jgi:hypothetical protein